MEWAFINDDGGMVPTWSEPSSMMTEAWYLHGISLHQWWRRHNSYMEWAFINDDEGVVPTWSEPSSMMAEAWWPSQMYRMFSALSLLSTRRQPRVDWWSPVTPCRYCSTENTYIGDKLRKKHTIHWHYINYRWLLLPLIKRHEVLYYFTICEYCQKQTSCCLMKRGTFLQFISSKLKLWL